MFFFTEKCKQVSAEKVWLLSCPLVGESKLDLRHLAGSCSFKKLATPSNRAGLARTSCGKNICVFTTENTMIGLDFRNAET